MIKLKQVNQKKPGQIHKFELFGAKIVLDVNSGAVHVIDSLAWDIIDDFPFMKPKEIGDKYSNKYQAADVAEVLEELSVLVEEGMLYSEDTYSADPLQDDRLPIVKSLCLNVSHDCNLRCRYCFAGSGNFGGERLLMPVETGCRAIDFLLESSAGRKHCEVDFFGGEPLMNIGVVEKITAYGNSKAALKGKEIKFTLTTNAVGLNNEIAEFLNRENISVVLSLDGRPEINDYMRVNPAGRGSYDKIKPNITKFINSRNNENYIVRGTYTGNNLNFSNDALHLADLGYKFVSVEPVVSLSSDEWAIKEEDLPEVFKAYETLCKEFVVRLNTDKEFEFFHFNLDLNKGPCLPKRLSGCGAGYSYMAVSPEGNLYPCHQFVGKENYLIGNVIDGIKNFDIVNQFRDAHVYNKEKCNSCWARFHCGGGCHANAEHINGSIMEPYYIGCELEKKRLEYAIYIQALKSGFC
ncbi:thioether cross-link-forming SCIFF peptide maturase [Phosphitispora sp. TUW77]|uniref:thioether cross-link-forming SCIFF peptide maturase n=1 Tax=Phosphitispora sp. TUW77 TaxID=3152361 RepID=UPI003AB4A00F